MDFICRQVHNSLSEMEACLKYASGFLFQDYAGVALTVPEPSAFWMTALGLALVTGAIRVKETTGDTH
jgi:hypothetical protein